MTLAELALRNLQRRPLRSVLSAFGIGLAVASAIALVALSRSVTGSVQASVDERGADLTIMQRGAADLFGGFLPAGLGQRIARVPGVTGVAPELVMFAPSEHNREIIVTGWPQTSFFWQHAPLAAGRLPHSGERQRLVEPQPEHAPLPRPDGLVERLQLTLGRPPGRERLQVAPEPRRVPPAPVLDCRHRADPDAEVVVGEPVAEVVP